MVKLILCDLGYIKDLIVGSKVFKHIFLSRLFPYKYIIVRVLLVPYSATSRELSGAAKASLRLGLGHPL